MERDIRYLDIIKMMYKYTAHKIEQYKLTTNETAIVDIPDGKVKGIKRTTVYDDSYYSFENIPFAKPPLGELRFRAPEPCEPWEGVRDCTFSASKPPQILLDINYVDGSEDCLYLNVYAKQLQSDKPLPVMVFIYGGGFQYGEASRDIYGPDYFMKENVVLVTIAYRLGPFGFLSLRDSSLDVPGNAGLKDQVLALKWVKNNIHLFNGDSNNITLFGESAGASSTHFLMITDQTKGLFHKAIVQSGSAVAEWAQSGYNSFPYRLAKAAGYKGEEDEKEILKFLMGCNSKKLLMAQKEFLNEEEIRNQIIFIFGPVIEPYITNQCVVPRRPVEMMRTCWSNKIPLLIGGCSFEGLFIYALAKKYPERLNQLGDCQYLVPPEACNDRSSEKCRELGLRLKQAHFGQDEPSEKHLFSYTDVFSYKFFWHALHRVVLSRTEYASAPTYLYRFDFDSPFFNQLRELQCGKGIRGVAHGDDISYLFYNMFAKKLSKDTPEYKTIERMIDIWTSFAATGNPNCDLIKPAVWEPVSRNNKAKKCLNISEVVQVIDLPEAIKLDVWDSFYEKDLY